MLIDDDDDEEVGDDDDGEWDLVVVNRGEELDGDKVVGEDECTKLALRGLASLLLLAPIVGETGGESPLSHLGEIPR